MARAGRTAGALVLALALAAAVPACAPRPPAQAVTADVHTGPSCLDASVLDALGLRLDPSLGASAPATTDTVRGAPPEDFVADTVLVCERGATLRDSAGEWRSVRATVLEGDLEPLLEGVGTTASVCSGGPGPQVWLVDALDDAVLLDPGTACGDGGVAAVLAALDVVAVTEHPVALVEGSGSVAG